MKKISILFILIVFMAGCTSKLCILPEAENSAMCTMADKMHMSLEGISQSLLVANIAGLEKDLYTAQQADKFVNQIITDIEKFRTEKISISYMDALKYINKKFKLLSPRAQLAFIIMNPTNLGSYDINLPLTDFDFDMILKHLNKQKEIISVYL